MPGTPVTNLWDDLPAVAEQYSERLDYPTQKPLALLERIISISSNPGGVVLDPFCGCGTSIAAAQKLGRQWIGIDVNSLAIAVTKYRLEDMYPGITYRIEGEPHDMDGAHDLANRDHYQFQWWALSLIRAQPLGGRVGSLTGKTSSDQGISGVIPFVDEASGESKYVLVQAKPDHVKSGDIRDLVGKVEREKAAIGVFITLEGPSHDMLTEAATAGYYRSVGWDKNFFRLQILTIDDLLKGHAGVDIPPQPQTL
jgi:site-specific DNA-methyltransferase (adenine-specific)